MNKFQMILTRDGDSIMAKRAESVTKLAEMSQVSLVQNLEKKKIQLEMKKQEMLDMRPDNRYSLKVGENFDASRWIMDYQSLGIQLINTEVELKVAQQTTAELFTVTESK